MAAGEAQYIGMMLPCGPRNSLFRHSHVQTNNSLSVSVKGLKALLYFYEPATAALDHMCIQIISSDCKWGSSK